MAEPFLALITPVGGGGVPGVPTHPIAPGGGAPVDPGYGYPERPVDPGYGYPIGGLPHPSHPIVIPPDAIAPGVPTHPIYIPVFPSHPIVIPPDAIGPGVPTHPIVLPPPRPEHPIVIPPGAIDGVHPEHPIYIPPAPPGIWGPPTMPPGFWGGGMGPGVKPQPPTGGGQPPNGGGGPAGPDWVFSPIYGWVIDPSPTGGKPVPLPPGDPNAPQVNPLPA